MKRVIRDNLISGLAVMGFLGMSYFVFFGERGFDQSSGLVVTATGESRSIPGGNGFFLLVTDENGDDLRICSPKVYPKGRKLLAFPLKDGKLSVDYYTVGHRP